MKKYRKIIDGKPVIKPRSKIVVVKDGKQFINPQEEVILADGWKEYVTPIYEPTAEELARQEAADLTEAARGILNDSDYKVIKCMEAYLCGESLPYDIVSLHIERDKQRRIINDYEEE